MDIFKKKETLLENMTFMGILSAINIVFVLLSTFVPFLFFLLVFVTPLLSCLTTLFAKKRYFPIYLIVTILLSFLATLGNIGDVLLYVTPGIITGFIFGLLIDLKIPSIMILYISTVVEAILTYLALPITKMLVNIDLIESISTMFSLNTHPYLEYIAPLFILTTSLIQMVLTYIIIKYQIVKIGKSIKVGSNSFYLVPLLTFVSLLLALIFGLTYKPFCLPFIALAVLPSSYLVIKIIIGRKTLFISLLGVSLLINIVISTSLYAFITKPLGLSLNAILLLLIGIIGLVNNYLSYKRKKDTIK